MDAIIFAKAAWLHGRELAHNAAIIVEDGRVLDAVPRDQLPVSLDDSVETSETDLLLPGFINAHCHLEYTLLEGRLPECDDTDFCAWLDAIYEMKRGITEDDYIASIKSGISRMIAGGATTVIDSTCRPESPCILADSPLRYFTFYELIAYDETRAAAVMDAFQALLAQPSGQRCIGVGVNPHAPYTVGGALRSLLLEYLNANPILRCVWHLCESSPEMQLFANGGGPMAEFLKRRQLPLPFNKAIPARPDEFLARHGLLERCDAAFHMNHPSHETGPFFRPPRMIVHCPATHEYFHRVPFPLWQLMYDGANIALGTDSAASSHSLSMLDMVRMAGREFPSLTGPQLLNLACRNAAMSSVLRDHEPPLGIIERGAAADFVSLSHPENTFYDLRETLISPDTRVASVWIAGKQARQ